MPVTARRLELAAFGGAAHLAGDFPELAGERRQVVRRIPVSPMASLPEGVAGFESDDAWDPRS